MRRIIALLLLGLWGWCGPAPAAAPGMRILLFGDPQVKSEQDLDYFRRDIVEPLRGRHRAQLGISLGDIVDDVPALLPAVRRETERLGVPWLHVPGNHDVDPDAQDDAGSLRSFRRGIGPDTLVRETALANVVVLDDVIALPGRKPAYIGGFRDDQFAQLEARLPALLVVSAHSHAQRHVFHGAASGWQGPAPLHEYNVGTASGAYWSGVKDAAGIPDATMADGTPNGYAVLDVMAGGTYALAWHNARDAADTSIGLHAPRVLRRGAYPGWGVFANVYMGMLRGFDRSPEAEVSQHLWRGALPTTLDAGEHRIEVRAFDRWRGEVRAGTRYRLQDRKP